MGSVCMELVLKCLRVRLMGGIEETQCSRS